MEDAREALRDGRFADAVKLCKQVLKQDRRNYDGFLVLGLALVRSSQHLDQAQMSLNKAISLDPAALPAHQAMIELRESTGSSLDVLAESIQAALEAAKGEPLVAAELTRKLARALSAASDHGRAKAAWNQLLAGGAELSEEQRAEALCGFVDAHTASAIQAKNQGHDDGEEEEEEALLARVKELVSMLPYNEKYRQLLLDLLLRKLRRGGEAVVLETRKELVSNSLQTLSTCPSTMAAEVLVTMAEDDDGEELFEDLSTGQASFRVWIGKHVAHLYPGRGISLASSKKMLAEWDLSCDDHSISGCRVLAKELVSEGLLEKASERAEKGLAAIALKRKSYGFVLKAAELEFRLVLGALLLLKKNHGEAARVFISVSEEANTLPEQRRKIIIGEAFQGLVKLSLATKEKDIAKSRLDEILGQDPQNHWALSERGWLAFEASSLKQAKTDLESAVSACQGSAVYHYRLGRVYWETEGMKDKAVQEFVESAKIDPGRAETFVYLGHYYREMSKDLRRAVRCYQKAVALDAENASIGEVLCDILDHGGQLSMEKAICEEAARKSPRSFWAWRRLGFIQVAENKWSEAISSTQYGLRGYPTDARLWEGLALSYKKLGMLTAASKAFGRAFDVDGNSLFAALEMGAIHLALSAFSKATHAYREALRISPGDFTAIHGLVSSLLGQARECFTQGAFWWCATIVKEAIDLAGRSRYLHGHLVAVWKSIGDASLMYAQSLPFESKDTHQSWEGAVDTWYTERVKAADNAMHAYRRAIHLLPSDASLYRDLATAMEYASKLNLSRPGHTQWSKAEVVICCGLQHDGANADMWVSLALVTQHIGLRQHALIQALRLDANHAIAWAYLGQLYLSLGEETLAQQSFDRARSADPTLSLPWAGMANIYYNISQRTNWRDQALEAFASCSCAVQLSAAPNVHLGVGQIAAQTQNLGLPQVNLALQHATHRQPLQAASHNLRGLSCEARSEYMPAVVAYRSARAAAAKASESTEVQTLITANLARALCKAGNAKAAVLEYNKLRDAGCLHGLDDIRSYCVALRNTGQGNQAEMLLKKMLTGKTPHDNREQFAAMLILLSKLTYFNQGAQHAFDVIWSAPDMIFSDASLCLVTLALAISTSTRDRISAAAARCRLVFSSKHGAEAFVLIASFEQADAVRDLRRAVHLYPQSGSLRAKLGQIILSHDQGLSSKLVERLCSVDSLVSDEEVSRKLSSLVFADVANACGLCGTEVLSCLQSRMHKEPWDMEARYCFILVLLGDTRRQGFPRHLCRTVLRMSTTALHHLSVSSDRRAAFMRMQLELCASECELRLGNYRHALDHAMASLNTVKKFPALNQAPCLLQLARCYRLLNDYSFAGSGAVADWQRQAEVSADNALWHLSLLDLKLRCGVIKEDGSMLPKLRHSLDKSGATNTRWLALLEALLAHFYYRKCELQRSEDAAANALVWWPDNPALCLLHGAIALDVAKAGKGTNYVSKAVSSLMKSVRESGGEVPIAHALLAQAESSRGKDGLSRASVVRKWAKHLRAEFLAWPSSEHPVPAELYFLMALLAKQQVGGDEGERCPESDRTWWSWLQAALHLNPASPKYWTLAQQLLS